MSLRVLLLGLLLAPALAPARAAAPSETIVLLRHAEKPAAGLGQLDCQGLNRALALPGVIARDFGRPTEIFAPNPAEMKKDGGVAYAYIRPLATIEPTAISLGMTVYVSIGVQDWQKLAHALDAPGRAGALVLVAWEHAGIVKLARALMRAHGGDPGAVPEWDKRDYDSLYVLRITGSKIAFAHQQEGLNNQPAACPK